MYEFLRSRGLRFFEEARHDLEKGFYDFCLFHVEQMFQLLLKYMIAVKLDDFPKTHHLSLLFKKVAELYGEDFLNFYRENIGMITALEEAYIGARYIDYDFDLEVAQESIRIAEKFIDLFNGTFRYGC